MSPPSSLVQEYLAQDRWRDWRAMLDALPIRADQCVLDLGCGPGLVSARLAARCAQVIGVDREAAFLAFARRRAPPNCTFIAADLAEFGPGAVAPADGLWSSFVAAYFPDLTPVLTRWVGCLKPGGWLALVEVDDLLAGHRPPTWRRPG